MRDALSFDGLATKINHHKTVSEYFTLRWRRIRVGAVDVDHFKAINDTRGRDAAGIDAKELATEPFELAGREGAIAVRRVHLDGQLVRQWTG